MYVVSDKRQYNNTKLTTTEVKMPMKDIDIQDDLIFIWHCETIHILKDDSFNTNVHADEVYTETSLGKMPNI